jgi:hypothetical protein
MNSLNGDMVTVLVGNRTFHVHENVLNASSQFFRNALKPKWRVERGKPIDLSDAKPNLFIQYSQWLYSGNLPSIAELPTRECKFSPLCELYILGERLIDAAFQNSLIDGMIVTSQHSSPSLEAIRIIYGGTAAGSPARKLLVDYSAWKISRPSARRVKELDPDIDAEFAINLVSALITYRPRPGKDNSPPWIARRELYHVNAPEEDTEVTDAATKDSVIEGESSTGKSSASTDSMNTTA